MTDTQFFFAKIFSQLGFPRTQKRLLEAADELHLLKEAQEVLGRNVWSDLKDQPRYQDVVAEIEQLLSEKERLTKKAEILKEEEIELRNKQDSKLNIPNKQHSDIQDQFRHEQAAMAEMKSKQAKIKSKASLIKLEHDQALKYLDKILTSTDVDQTAVEIQKNKIKSFKQTFSELKKKKIQLDRQLVKATEALTKISDTINNTNDAQQNSNVERFKAIGEKNKEISTLLSRVGLIENNISAHYGEVGKVISLEVIEDSNSRKLIKSHFGLCKIINALRKSIKYNHVLSGRT